MNAEMEERTMSTHLALVLLGDYVVRGASERSCISLSDPFQPSATTYQPPYPGPQTPAPATPFSSTIIL